MRFLVAIAFLFAFCDLACTQPVISRGQQILAISYDDCLRRGQSAFSTEGWANIGTSGNAVAAFKGIHGSYIVCNPAPDAKMAVNIFVASNSNDSGVPGLERQRLQARMESSGSPPPTLQRSCWRWDVEMQDGRRVDAILEMKANGDLFIAKWGLTGKWTAQGAQYVFDWGRGPGNQDFLRMEGNVLTGKNYQTNWIRGTLLPSCG